MQKLAERQETLERELFPAVPAFGLGTTDHVPPFHDSTRVPDTSPEALYAPTAVHELADRQEMPERLLALPLPGLDATDQALPFQVSISAFSTGDFPW